MMFRHALPCVLLASACLGIPLRAAVRWDFNGTGSPSGAKLELRSGTPTFTTTGEEEGLAAGTRLEWADTPELRLRPELEILCRFRLDELGQNTHVLAMKDGEYILRVDWRKEGSHLSFFVQVEGRWEPRLRGPVVQPGTWYEVHAAWSGQTMTMNVNGETFKNVRSGAIRPGANPLQIGPVVGIVDRLEIRNPGLERMATLRELSIDAKTPAADKGMLSGRRSSGMDGKGHPVPVVLGGEGGWVGWQGTNGAKCTVRGDTVMCTFPSAAAMLLSPALACEVAPFPFVCLETTAPGPGWTGHLGIVSDEGVGSLSFQPRVDGGPTVVSGVLADAWTGTLRRLSLSFSGGKGPIAIRRLTLADRPIGTPLFYIRSLAAGRAKLRPGREETVVMGLQNVGGEVEGITARLTAPAGIRIVGETTHTLPYLGMDDFDMATWRVRVGRPGTYTVCVAVAAAGAETQTRDLALVVEPLPELSDTDYVPKPRPAQTDYISLMHYCPLWQERPASWNSWNKIEPWPERRPAIGWYDEGAPEVADWHIKYALEHGINGFIYCWYRRGLGAEIEQSSGHAIHEGLYNARYRDMFTFTIMWTSGSTPVEDEADLLENLMPFWLENYFTHPSYLKIDNHPIFFVYRARALIAQLGGPEKARHALNRMRAQCRVAGFKGMRILACMSAASQKLGPEIVASGWDGVTGYCLRPKGIATAGVDPAGLAYYDYADVLSRYKQTWIDRDACTGDVPDIPNVVMGWDTRAWASAVKRGRGWYIATPQVQTFEAACRDAKELVDAKAAERWDSRMVVFDNWTEFGEGHYIEPTTGTGFSFVNAIKRVFCSDWAPESVTDIIPEDLGMLPPQRRYEDARAGYGNRMPWQPVRLVGDLLVCWEFEREKDGYFLDSSLNDCRLRPEGGTVVSGRGGKILCCNNGGATFPATVPFFGDSGVVSPAVAPFFHPGGVSIALWCKPAEANQSNRWMLSAAGTPARYRRQELGGYRLGLSGGCPVWQVPREKWDDGLRAPDPLPVDEWSHVAATFDSRTMRLYVNGKEVASLARRGHVKRGRPLITVGAQNAGPDRMGGYTPGPGTQFRGWLDSIRVWRRVLPTDEIAVFAGE